MADILKDGVVVRTQNINLSFYIDSKKREVENLNEQIEMLTLRKNTIIADLEGLAPVESRPQVLADVIAEVKPTETTVEALK
jgi:hypothetical protein